MARCEDYPCCGHTDGLPCDWTPPDHSSDPHALCDHEDGICEVWYDEEDDEDLDEDDEDEMVYSDHPLWDEDDYIPEWQAN